MAITFPVGFLFRPTDKEVIQHYLLKKQIGEELPLNGVIQERDVYSEEVLSEATWRSESVDDIRLDENTVIGKKRVLDYINPGSVEHRDWSMKEYSLDGVMLEFPQTSSDYVVCLLEKKERAIKHDRQKKMQSKRNAPVNTPSGCFNNKRIKLSSKQNKQIENRQTDSAPLVDEQVGLINGEAGVETLEQITQYLLEPDSSMVDVDEENVERVMQYLLEPDSPLDSMPPLMEAKPAPTVNEDGGYPSGENEVRMQPSIHDQSLPSSNREHAVLDYINSLASAPEVTAIENDLLLLFPPPALAAFPAPTVNEDGGYPSGENEVRMQPSIHDQSLPSSNREHAVLDYINSLASAPEVTAIENDVGILEQPSINKKRRLLLVASIHGEAVEPMVNENVAVASLPPPALAAFPEGLRQTRFALV
ncbi:hypothetical protein Acr_17g0012780 [Actinidia rufa]|uniref:NAC domain-containing protein n=1 Tax=Actinidia rufa TaxID=165716 RepID=A0A7J0G4H9_9ERIC|nr:hypothetical protein Acr_17g0012780 [Actinidia rufa]